MCICTCDILAVVDQWSPADLKLLSKEACEELANSFDMIEKGASWPKQLLLARAAFLSKDEGDPTNSLKGRSGPNQPSRRQGLAYHAHAISQMGYHEATLGRPMYRGMGYL